MGKMLPLKKELLEKLENKSINMKGGKIIEPLEKKLSK